MTLSLKSTNIKQLRHEGKAALQLPLKSLLTSVGLIKKKKKCHESHDLTSAWILLTFSLAPFISAEKLADDLNASVPKMPSESASEGLAPKVT